jgi:hypothetical protein
MLPHEFEQIRNDRRIVVPIPAAVIFEAGKGEGAGGGLLRISGFGNEVQQKKNKQNNEKNASIHGNFTRISYTMTTTFL